VSAPTRGVRLPWTGTWEPQAYWSRGLPAWRHGWVPARLYLATRRQLRAAGLSPAQQPCAVVEWGRRGGFAWLYRIELAAPHVEQTPARQASLAAAMRGRRTCPVCRTERGYCIPKVSLGGCHDCHAAGRCRGTLDELPARLGIAA
jgi:hypothetical protein